jgi:hypothetical protein
MQETLHPKVRIEYHWALPESAQRSCRVLGSVSADRQSDTALARTSRAACDTVGERIGTALASVSHA